MKEALSEKDRVITSLLKSLNSVEEALNRKRKIEGEGEDEDGKRKKTS